MVEVNELCCECNKTLNPKRRRYWKLRTKDDGMYLSSAVCRDCYEKWKKEQKGNK